MNWGSISAIADTVGLVVIVVSLVYISRQTKQANNHASASTELGFMEGVNAVFNGWASDEHTANVIRRGLKSFSELTKAEQALFDGRVGALLNQMILGDALIKSGLLRPAIAEEVRKVAISVMCTDGGLEYFEHASNFTPDGPAFLAIVRQARGKQASIADLVPWWAEG